MTQRNIYFSLLSLVLLFVAVGCDSGGGDETSDADTFVGTWIPSKIVDGDGDQTALFATNVESFTAQLKSDDTFAINVDYTDVVNQAGQADVNLAGTYSVNESSHTVLLTVPGAAALPFSYTIQNDNTIDLSAQAALVNLAFGTNYTGTVVLTIVRA